MAGDTIITLIGNLTAEPELRFTPSGAAVVLLGTAMTGGSVGDLWGICGNRCGTPCRHFGGGNYGSVAWALLCDALRGAL